MNVDILPLVPDAPLPRSAPASVRERVPAGYGVQEQCLPFTAAAALGMLIPAPFDFGLCPPDEVPAGAHSFRSPLDVAPHADPQVFYVRDAPDRRFVRNAFSLTRIAFRDSQGKLNQMNPVQPGLSFFERPDQAAHFKLHLPFVLRTPPDVDTLFCAPINRASPAAVVAGLVETDWFPHPVNLVLGKPEHGSMHVRTGAIVAQAVFIGRATRRPRIEVVPDKTEPAAQQRNALLKWYVAHSRDRSAYKRLVRSRLGRLDGEQT